MQISGVQIMTAEKLSRLAAFDVSDPAMPADKVYALIGQRMVDNRLGECQIFEPAHRAAFWALITDKAMPRAAEAQVGLILTDPRRTEDQKMTAILHIIASYRAITATDG